MHNHSLRPWCWYNSYYCTLCRLDQGESVANLPHLFLLLTTLWLSDKPEVLTATTLTMRALVEEVVGPAAALPQHRTAVVNVIATVQAGLKYQYHAAWTHVLHVIGVLFKVTDIYKQLIIYFKVKYWNFAISIVFYYTMFQEVRKPLFSSYLESLNPTDLSSYLSRI